MAARSVIEIERQHFIPVSKHLVTRVIVQSVRKDSSRRDMSRVVALLEAIYHARCQIVQETLKKGKQPMRARAAWRAEGAALTCAQITFS
jgi:hypothetical protein